MLDFNIKPIRIKWKLHSKTLIALGNLGRWCGLSIDPPKEVYKNKQYIEKIRFCLKTN